MGTHVAQKAPSESMGDAHDYMEVTCPKMCGAMLPPGLCAQHGSDTCSF